MNFSGLWPDIWYKSSTVQREALANPLENLASPDGGGTPVGRTIFLCGSIDICPFSCLGAFATLNLAHGKFLFSQHI
jgi:hypothetical protein